MSEAASAPVRTFSIGYSDDPVYDETSYARLAASRFGAQHTEFMVGPQSIDLVDRLVDAYDEPFGDSSAIPTYIVSELRARDVTVALVGDGGDELFAGYLRFYARGALRARAGRGLRARRVGGSGGCRTIRIRAAPRAASRASSRPRRCLSRSGCSAGSVSSPARSARSCARSSRPEIDDRKLADSFREPLERTRELSPLARVLDLNFRTYLLDDLLPKADRCSMAHGLELRSPFLDTAVMELAASLPDRLKLRTGATKVILRRAFRDLLPDEIQKRGKMGFGIPICRPGSARQWRPLVEERLLPGARGSSVAPPGGGPTLAEQHFAATADYGHQLWALLTLETFLQQEGRA